ncbi:uncharacterized protein LOC100377968 [Saccoglossus kowalevskii]|uniref:Uncharacterized protein LOC100377968 n=1 Tax=Saccoglossus kowalevskii TaxID=10224 RepID=A0ABM0M4N0_SACKO|nr:PREDICTED: uncharacterized protein LOC100377968 [Saccoglossus kowalevskii]
MAASVTESPGEDLEDFSPRSRQHGDRKFYNIPEQLDEHSAHDRKSNKKRDDVKFFQYIDESVIGRETTFSGPYGRRKVIYCDYIASGRSLKFIEDYINSQVLPVYGNTHTTTTVTSLQTTLYRHEARDIVRNAVNASEHDAVIFVGSGCTAAIHKLINALDLQQPPVVFIGPYEHHSNILPWRELGAEVIRISETSNGIVDMKCLEENLKKWNDSSRQLIGCFAAASNITGILSDTIAITICLHKYGALAFWDYATAGPYVNIDMNPVAISCDQSLVYKDAIFLSPHKFVGGVQTPGILIAKKNLFKNSVPSGGGGGAVFFVTRETHRYLQQVEMREEGGTPDIVGSIRAGLVFQLKEAVGADVIMKRESILCRKALDSWKTASNLIILGNVDVPRLPVFSFLIRHPTTGQYLHHNFICAILNDVFGVQARGGCACAGPYAQDLLGIDEDLSLKIEALLLENSRLDRIHLRRYHEYSEREILRPGFARLNLPYFMSDECVDFIIKAVAMVAEHGWKLLPQYMFNPETGEWKNRGHQVFQDRRWLGHITYSEGRMQYSDSMQFKEKGRLPNSCEECLIFANDIFVKAIKVKVQLPDQCLLFDQEATKLRWFMLPSEALAILKIKDSCFDEKHVPFHPPSQQQQQTQSPETDMNIHDQDEFSRRRNCDIVYANTDIFAASVEDGFTAFGDRHKPGDVKGRITSQGLTNIRDNQIDSQASISNILDHLPVPANLISADTETDGLTTSSSSSYEPQLSERANRIDNKHDEVVNDGKTGNTQSMINADISTLQEEEIALSLPSSELITCTLPDKTTVVKQEQKMSVAIQHPCKTETKKAEGKKSKIDPSKPRFHAPPKNLFKPAVQALEEYNMIENGDKVLVCLSGGKDSLSLLHTLRQYQFYASKKGIDYSLGAVTVDPQTPSFDPSPLKDYLKALNVPYFYEEQGIIEQAKQLAVCESICSFCSRMKRGRIYACARREGYNVLAMGQHLDDLTESFLMSAFHNGLLRTMKANYSVKEGDLRVIRPLVYVRETDTRSFAEQVKLPVIAENCPACFEAPKERHRTKQLLAAQELLFPDLYQSLLTAMKPLMSKNRTGMESGQNKLKTLGNSDSEV